jgi:hypothetical protein
MALATLGNSGASGVVQMTSYEPPGQPTPVNMPIMTSGVAPAPYVVTHNNARAGFEGWRVFDGAGFASTIGWRSTEWVPGPFNLDINFGQPYIVSSISYYAGRIDRNAYPRDWSIQVSEDGITWTVHASFTNMPGSGDTAGYATNRTFAAVTTQYLRWRITSTWSSGTGQVLHIGKVVLA